MSAEHRFYQMLKDIARNNEAYHIAQTRGVRNSEARKRHEAGEKLLYLRERNRKNMRRVK